METFTKLAMCSSVVQLQPTLQPVQQKEEDLELKQKAIGEIQ
jgi:hypothetical protein